MMKAHDTVTIHDLRSLEQAAMEIKRCAERMRSIAASCRIMHDKARVFDAEDSVAVDASVAGIQNEIKRIGERLGIATGML